MTLEGTNTWVLREPDATQVVVIDPGPDDVGHLTGVAEHGPIDVILLTHGHPDHASGARRLHELTKAPVRALDPRHRLGSEGLQDGDVVEAGDLEVRVIATPGHSADSLCFVLPAERAILTGDTVLGRGTSVVAHPDGRLVDYLSSLRRLRSLVDEGIETVLPGHGPVLPSAACVLDYYLQHREERLEQVRAALAAGAHSARAVVEVVYADVDRVLWPAAELSVRAQLDYLAETGQLDPGVRKPDR
jgi:glyoxylase-like metal-dependent hydrolase (beta-lactamase superfamily II)